MKETNTYNIFSMAQKQFDRSAELLGLEPATRQLLRSPLREYQFNMPIFLDNGDPLVLKGFVVQYNDSRGPTKGGIRFHPDETIDTIRALGMWMTWKCAVANLPLGGASSGVACDPHALTPNELERVCRAFVRRSAHITGPEWDILGLDVMTSPQHMLWMLDEYETIHQRKSPGYISGKPIGHAGSKGCKEASGFGVMISVREALKAISLPVENTSASFQGFGAVGMNAARLYSQMGGKIVAVSTWNPGERSALTFRNRNGIDFEALAAVSNSFGEIDKTKAVALGCECLPGDAWLEQEVDILVPAALENQIRTDNVDRIHRTVKVIAEGANGPTDPEADAALQSRGITVLPDILANAGGVVCSYFETVQSNMNYFWGKEEVLSKLDHQLTSAYRDVTGFARGKNISMRDAAYMLAVDRVARACHDRHWI